MALLCFPVLLALALSCSAQRRLIGTLPNLQHRISGTLYAEGDRTFVIEGFGYDGLGPDAFVYVYEKGATVSRFGGGLIIKLPGTSDGRFVNGRSYSNEQLTASLDDCTGCRAGLTIRDLQSFTIWCRRFSVFFTRLDIPADLFDQAGEDVLMPPDSYNNCEPLSDELQVSWTVNQTANMAFFQLCGCVDAGDYMAFGLSGSDSTVEMVGADAVVTWQDDKGTGAVDYYLSQRAQCRPNVQTGPKGVCPDDVQGGLNNATALRGRRDSNGRCVEYVRPLNASDPELDQAITPDIDQYIVWATGPRGTVDGFAYFHTSWPRDRQGRLRFGRTPANNCPTLSCPMPPSCTFTQETFDVRNMDATFIAEIGQSGGQRGYEGLTGRSGWGIAWYINSTLAPVIRVTRGNTYTFYIYGGSNASNAGRYHPFYISDYIAGGRLANTPEERAVETVYAGITAEETAVAVGPLCSYEEGPNSASTREDCSATFADYFATLQRVCHPGQPGVLEWTPDIDTPDTVYYQCATHANLGWRFNVSEPSSEDTDITTKPGPQAPSTSLVLAVVVPLGVVAIIAATVVAIVLVLGYRDKRYKSHPSSEGTYHTDEEIKLQPNPAYKEAAASTPTTELKLQC